jgi:CBS domain-containing protein
MVSRSMSDVVHNRRPVTLSASATVQQACVLMRDRRIGAVVITAADGGPEGIFTGRDAVRLLAEGHNPAHTHLRAVMTPNPVCMSPDQRAMDALHLMQDGGFRHVPVVAGGKVIGIASAADFRSYEFDRLDEETGYWERI